MPGLHDPAKVAHIGRVHRHDPIVRMEVRRLHLPRALAPNVDPMRMGDSDALGVWRVSDVPGARSRGVDHKTILKPLLDDELTKHTFGHGRATYVAETHEQYRRLVGPLGLLPAFPRLLIRHTVSASDYLQPATESASSTSTSPSTLACIPKA